MKKFRILLCACAAFACGGLLEAQDLSIQTDDIRIDFDAMPGYHLKIRRKPGIASVMLTESTESETRKPATYAYQNPSYNPINGNEKRLLDGKELQQETGHFLMDSTPEPDAAFGEAFHIFIPYVMEYGYPWGRHGEVQVLDGTYLSIRAFSKPYADYSGDFLDNPFTLRIVQRPLDGAKADNIMPSAAKSYEEIATEGEALKSPGQKDMIDKIASIIDKQKAKALDFVLVLDTTRSMHDDIPYLRDLLVPTIREYISRFESFRAGLVVYRDYNEEYLNRVFPFTEDLEQFQRLINGVRVAGGRDIPEAVHEALDAAIRGYDWQAEKRVIVLVGDAPPHPRPRGKATEESVKHAAQEKNITLYTIILPQ
ncbi:MAG: VWA domain-containing protein [Spirochaetia bacterium]|jgi:hypothetical protein|nr:VWA domain-containing protein [Spirochaetia bacterium]